MEGEGIKKKRFDRDFKISAVKMVTQEGHKASEVARSLGIHPNQLYNWKKLLIEIRRVFWDNDRNFDVSRPNAVWVTDITYIWTFEGWLYLAAILDLFS